MKLALTQMVLGVLIVTSTILISVWGFPLSYSVSLPESQTTMRVFINPGPKLIAAQEIAGATVVLGLAVLGCGIAQFLRARVRG